MDPTVYREHLERLLTDEAGILSRLESILEREHGVIVAQDIDALERTGAERQKCVGELMRIEDERRGLCRMLGKSSDAAGLEQIIKWCDPKTTLRPHLDECAARATRCRDANDRNGMLVATRLKRVEGMLNVITGKTAQTVTYGKQNAYAAAATGRMIQREA